MDPPIQNIPKAYDGRTMPASMLDIRNAEHRAVWTLKYFGGVVCPDNRTVQEQSRFLYWYLPKLRSAQRYLRGFHGG